MMQGFIYFPLLVISCLSSIAIHAAASELPQVPFGDVKLHGSVTPTEVHQGRASFVEFTIAFNNTGLPTKDTRYNTPLMYEADISSDQYTFEHCLHPVTIEVPQCTWASRDGRSAKLLLPSEHHSAPNTISTSSIKILLVARPDILGDTFFTVAVRNPISNQIVARTKVPHIKGPTLAVVPPPFTMTLDSPMNPATVPKNDWSEVMVELLSNIDNCVFMCKPVTQIEIVQEYTMEVHSDAFEIMLDESPSLHFQIGTGNAAISPMQQRLHVMPKPNVQEGADTTIRFVMKRTYWLSAVAHTHTFALSGNLSGPKVGAGPPPPLGITLRSISPNEATVGVETTFTVNLSFSAANTKTGPATYRISSDQFDIATPNVSTTLQAGVDASFRVTMTAEDEVGASTIVVVLEDANGVVAQTGEGGISGPTIARAPTSPPPPPVRIEEDISREVVAPGGSLRMRVQFVIPRPTGVDTVMKFSSNELSITPSQADGGDSLKNGTTGSFDVTFSRKGGSSHAGPTKFHAVLHNKATDAVVFRSPEEGLSGPQLSAVSTSPPPPIHLERTLTRNSLYAGSTLKLSVRLMTPGAAGVDTVMKFTSDQLSFTPSQVDGGDALKNGNRGVFELTFSRKDGSTHLGRTEFRAVLHNKATDAVIFRCAEEGLDGPELKAAAPTPKTTKPPTPTRPPPPFGPAATPITPTTIRQTSVQTFSVSLVGPPTGTAATAVRFTSPQFTFSNPVQRAQCFVEGRSCTFSVQFRLTNPQMAPGSTSTITAHVLNKLSGTVSATTSFAGPVVVSSPSGTTPSGPAPTSPPVVMLKAQAFGDILNPRQLPEIVLGEEGEEVNWVVEPVTQNQAIQVPGGSVKLRMTSDSFTFSPSEIDAAALTGSSDPHLDFSVVMTGKGGPSTNTLVNFEVVYTGPASPTEVVVARMESPVRGPNVIPDPWD